MINDVEIDKLPTDYLKRKLKTPSATTRSVKSAPRKDTTAKHTQVLPQTSCSTGVDWLPPPSEPKIEQTNMEGAGACPLGWFIPDEGVHLGLHAHEGGDAVGLGNVVGERRNDVTGRLHVLPFDHGHSAASPRDRHPHSRHDRSHCLRCSRPPKEVTAKAKLRAEHSRSC